MRRAAECDYKPLAQLVSRLGGGAKFRKLFGTHNLAGLVETGYLTLVTVAPPARSPAAEDGGDGDMEGELHMVVIIRRG